jgi:hypothetical protein
MGKSRKAKLNTIQVRLEDEARISLAEKLKGFEEALNKVSWLLDRIHIPVIVDEKQTYLSKPLSQIYYHLIRSKAIESEINREVTSLTDMLVNAMYQIDKKSKEDGDK